MSVNITKYEAAEEEEHETMAELITAAATPIHGLVGVMIPQSSVDRTHSKDFPEGGRFSRHSRSSLGGSTHSSHHLKTRLLAAVAETSETDKEAGDMTPKPDEHGHGHGGPPVKMEVPNMWSKDYIGLYCQYAGVGLLYGSTGTLIPFCVYHFDGSSNVCSNARNITTFAWSMKIFYAVVTDCYRPFGMRRKPWMLMGWAGVLLLLLVLACTVHLMDTSVWLVTLLFTQAFMMLSDVPGDGYCVELGHHEPKEQRGQILATGQRIRFSFCVVAGIIQTLLLNGPTTSSDDCPIAADQCWAWGLTINQYYAVQFVIIFVLTVPIFWLKELDASHIPRHTFSHFFHEVWLTLQNLTTFYLLIFVIGTYVLTNFTNNASIYLQYYVIQLTNLEAGIDTMMTFMCLVVGIYIFQRYLINRNWRHTQYGSNVLTSFIGLLWILAYNDIGGTRDPWFTIFIDSGTYFSQGIAQVLYSMAVIELAKPGQEATTFELIITVGNSATLMNGILSTQLLTPMKATGCDDDGGNCPSDTVDVTSVSAYEDSNGPERFTYYCLLLVGISIGACLIFTPFLPASKEQCAEWKELGDRLGTSETRGRWTLAIVTVVVLYGIIAAVLLLNTTTACQPAIGGTGC